MNQKVIIIVSIFLTILIILAAAFYILNSNKSKTENAGSVLKETTIPNQSTNPPAVIILSSSSPQVKAGETFSVSVNISSRTPSDGTDIILLYNPNLLSVESASGKAVIVGSIYPEYPINSDDKKGTIRVSGISSQLEGTVASGLFGTINFKALKAGKASINLEFSKGLTTDSNVTETESSKDILEAVQNVDVLIN